MSRVSYFLRLGVSLAFLVFALALSGCEVGGDDGSGGAADASSSQNALGQICTIGAAAVCPSTPAHICTKLDTVGSQTQGYCSPLCTTSAECTSGYTGPATGTPTCFPDALNQQRCVIICQSEADCPNSLACLAPGGAPMKFCVVGQ